MKSLNIIYSMMNELDDSPPSEDRKIPRFLLFTYFFMFVWGLWAFVAYWNGSHGWLDRGYWQALQQAAHTTHPFEKKEPYLKINIP